MTIPLNLGSFAHVSCQARRWDDNRDMPAAWEAERLVAEVRRLAVRGLPRDEYHRELAARLRRTIAIDATCWHGLDPRTLLLTTASPEELLQRGFLSTETEPLAAQTVLASEYQRDDYNTFAALARRRAPVGILSEATRGRPERSARYREFLAPRGTPFEMRAAFVTHGRAWGCVVFHRSQATGDFQGADAQLIARLSRPIAEGLRTSLRVDAARRPDDDRAPGLILLGPGNEVELATPLAQVLLEPLRHDSPGSSTTVPLPILALAATARQLQHSRGSDAAVALHVPSDEGWLSLHASLPDGTTSARVAIVIQRASREHTAPLRLEIYGLSDRERQIATLVATGLSTKALAERLFLSPWTVQDHLKSIFDKTRTRSRRELRARIFFDEFLPGIATRAPLAADGALTPRPAHPPD
jgi:DNA-binding CsgD family transcriptional regulator